MPVKACNVNGKPGWKWGDRGRCYTYEKGDDTASGKAKQKAYIQGYAATNGTMEESMTTKLAEKGKTVSAANQAKIRAIVDALTEFIDREESEDTTNGVAEAILKIGPVRTLDDVKKAMDQLIAYIPNVTTREQLEGDGDGDGADDDKDGNEGAILYDGTPSSLAASRRDLYWDITEAVLKAKKRNSLPDEAFAIPEKRAYPIHDESHARNALTRVAQHGTPEEKKRVKAAVKRKYPNIDVSEAGITCASCGEPVGRYDDYCGNCGEGLTRSTGSAMAHCVGCGMTLGPDNKYCPGCGKEAAPSIATQKKQKESWKLSEAMKQHDDSGFTDMVPSQQRQHMMTMHGVAKDSPNLRVPARRIAKHQADHAAGANDNDADDVNEAADVEVTTEFIPLRERAIGRDGTMLVKMIAPGWGSSGYYPKEVLERDASKAYPKGSKMFLDHPTLQEEKDRPERSVRDLAAVTEEAAHYLEEGPDGPGIYSAARPLSPQHAEILENLAPHIGVSIRASGKARKGEAEGKKGQIIEAIVKGQSCDFVTEPGAGGKVLQLWESAKRRFSHSEEEDDVELQEALKRNRDLEAENKRLKERLVMREAYDFAMKSLSDVEQLPPMSVRRLSESLSFNPPVDEFDELDKKAFKQKITEAVADEAKYIQSLRQTGKVRGMGRSNDSWELDGDDEFSESSRGGDDDDDDDRQDAFTKSLQRQFQRVGLSEGIAREAAVGRR